MVVLLELLRMVVFGCLAACRNCTGQSKIFIWSACQCFVKSECRIHELIYIIHAGWQSRNKAACPSSWVRSCSICKQAVTNSEVQCRVSSSCCWTKLFVLAWMNIIVIFDRSSSWIRVAIRKFHYLINQMQFSCLYFDLFTWIWHWPVIFVWNGISSRVACCDSCRDQVTKTSTLIKITENTSYCHFSDPGPPATW